MATDLSQS
jgi:hypothetical protein